jgi:UDP-glucose 4-epimerase
MNIVVTGAHGFVGLNLVKTLASSGHTVLAVGRRAPDAWVTEFLKDQSGVKHLVSDVSRPGELSRALSGHRVDTVVHAAVVTATTFEVEKNDAARIIHVNVGGTIEALEAAQLSSAKRFVYVSSPSAFGTAPISSRLDESVLKQPDSLYGISKDSSEEIVRRFGRLHGISTASVRIAQPYGPGERATASRVRTSPIYEWVRDAEAGRTLPTGPMHSSRDWTYIDDTAAGIAQLAIAEAIQHDLYHLARGSLVSVEEVIKQISRAYPGLRWNVEPRPAELNPNISDPDGRKPLECARFRNEFGWQPETDIVVGMRRYLDWWNAFPTSGS